MYEIHAEERQVIGRTVKTWEREIIDACMLKAAAARRLPGRRHRAWLPDVSAFV